MGIKESSIPMMKNLLLVMVLAMAVGACSKEHIIERKEDKIIGAWVFDKVFYKKDHALFRDDISHLYRDDIIEFFPDYTAIYDDFSLREVFDGQWSLIVDDDFYYDDGGSDLEFFIDAVFFDYIHGEEFTFFGSITRLGRERLHFESHDRKGVFTFKLRRY